MAPAMCGRRRHLWIERISMDKQDSFICYYQIIAIIPALPNPWIASPSAIGGKNQRRDVWNGTPTIPSIHGRIHKWITMKTQACGGGSLVWIFINFGWPILHYRAMDIYSHNREWWWLGGNVKAVFWIPLHTLILEYEIDRSLGLIRMDNGRDLAASPLGPWTPELGSHISTFPVIQWLCVLCVIPSLSRYQLLP